MYFFFPEAEALVILYVLATTVTFASRKKLFRHFCHEIKQGPKFPLSETSSERNGHPLPSNDPFKVCKHECSKEIVAAFEVETRSIISI